MTNVQAVLTKPWTPTAPTRAHSLRALQAHRSEACHTPSMALGIRTQATLPKALNPGGLNPPLYQLPIPVQPLASYLISLIHFLICKPLEKLLAVKAGGRCPINNIYYCYSIVVEGLTLLSPLQYLLPLVLPFVALSKCNDKVLK